jgi:CrcB protein
MNPINVITLPSLLLVAAGGAIGCVLRFMAIRGVSMLHGSNFPLGTMVVNIVGSLLIGAVLAKYGHEHSVRAFVVTGILGGFTTFSAFSWDALQLLQRGQAAQAAMYVLGSVGLSVAAVALGYQMVK